MSYTMGYTERIAGGKARGMTPADFDPVALERGTAVELEHTPSRAIAREIAMDHLAEDPRYYEKLQTIDPHHGLGQQKPSRTSPATGLWALAIGVGLIAAGSYLTKRQGPGRRLM